MSIELRDDQSLGYACISSRLGAGVSADTALCHITFLTLPLLLAASLDMMASKENAHSHWVTSVAFSPDGKTIVSGSYDHTIKVTL